MDGMVDSGIRMLNALGQTFCVHAWRAFAQSSVLVVVLLLFTDIPILYKWFNVDRHGVEPLWRFRGY